MSSRERLTGQDFPDNGETGSRIRKEMESLGTELWRGDPLVVASKALIPVGQTRHVRFHIASSNLPRRDALSEDVLRDFLHVHVRSRYAHLALDVPEDFIDRLMTEIETKVVPNGNNVVRVELINHGSRPVTLQKGQAPLHLFVVPPDAEIKGEELDGSLGKEEDRPIRMFGKETDDWERYYELVKGSDGGLKLELQGVYVRILRENPADIFWMPGSDDPITLSEEGDYTRVREYLFENYFVSASVQPVPQDHLWIGKLARQSITEGIYGILSNDVYHKIGNSFRKTNTAFQTSSPLIEGRVNKGKDGEELPHHVEIKGKAEWVLIKYVRGKVVRG